MRGTVAMQFSAFGTAVNDDVSLFWVGFYADGLHLTPAGVGTIPGIDVYVEGPQTKRAVVA